MQDKMAEIEPIKVEIEVLHVWQLCPKCNGEGTVWMPSSTVKQECDLCNGKKIISKVTGEPPQMKLSERMILRLEASKPTAGVYSAPKIGYDGKYFFLLQDDGTPFKSQT